MKNWLVIAAIAASGGLISCSNGAGGPSATEKKNIEVNDAIMKAYEAGDFSKMGDYIAADAVDHGSDKGVDVVGLDSIVADMKRYKAMMPDMKASNTITAASGDYVFTRATVSGTMNGQQMTMTSVDLARFKDGKAVEHWIYMDPKDMMAMMPQHKPEQPAAPADSLGKK